MYTICAKEDSSLSSFFLKCVEWLMALVHDIRTLSTTNPFQHTYFSITFDIPYKMLSPFISEYEAIVLSNFVYSN